MKIAYNSPTTLSFTIICTIIHLIKHFLFSDFIVLFTAQGSLENAGFLTFFGLFSHVLGHADWDHLLSNLSLILILGPILEEKYGAIQILFMILITAFATGVLNLLLFDSGILGASGIVFMMILLSSITNFKSGEIPLTFVLVLFFYIGREVISVFNDDQISQFGHIIGGICGACFGFFINREKSKKNDKPKRNNANFVY